MVGVTTPEPAEAPDGADRADPTFEMLPGDNRTTVAESTGWQRHTMRATYRALRAAHQPWQARSAIVRLLNMDAALTHGRPVRGAA